MITKTIYTLLAVSLTIASSISANATNGYSLQGKHHITLNAGSSTDGNNYEGRDYDNIGGLEYSYWKTDSFAINVKLNGMVPDQSDRCFHRHNDDDIGLGNVLMGVEYRPDFMNVGENAFFSLNASVGPHTGVFQKSELKNQGNRRHCNSEETTKFGAYIGGKFTLVLRDRFTLGAFAGYHHIAKFKMPNDQKMDFSSPDMGISFGVLF